MMDNIVVCWKVLNTIHRILVDGHHNVFGDSGELGRYMLNGLKRKWEIYRENSVMAKMIAAYCDFLQQKIEFHNRHTMFDGSFSLEEYLRKRPTNTNNANTNSTIVGHLLDYQASILQFQNRTFKSTTTLDDMQVWALIPLVTESYGVYSLTTYFMKILVNQLEEGNDVFAFLSETYYSQYIELREYYFKAGNCIAITSVIPVPMLPIDPPQFIRTKSSPSNAKHKRERTPKEAVAAPQIIQLPEDVPRSEPPPPAQPAFVPLQPFDNPFAQQAQNLQFQPFFSPFAPPATPSPIASPPQNPGWVNFSREVQFPIHTVNLEKPQVNETDELKKRVAELENENTKLRSDFALKEQEYIRRILELENIVRSKDEENAKLRNRSTQLESIVAAEHKKLQDAHATINDLSTKYDDLAHDVDEERKRRVAEQLAKGFAMIEAAMFNLDNPNFDGDADASSDKLRDLSKRLGQNIADLFKSVTSPNGTDLVANEEAVKSQIESVVETLRAVIGQAKGCVTNLIDGNSTDDLKMKKEILENARNSGKSIVDVLMKLQSIISHSDNWNNLASSPELLRLNEEAQRIARQIEQEIEKLAQDIARGELDEEEKRKKKQAEEELAKSGVNANQFEAEATNQLLAAAKAIEEASKRLAEARQKAELQKQNNTDPASVSNSQIAGPLLDAAGGIAAAAAKLVHAATEAQREREKMGLMPNSEENSYLFDPAWSQGLVSAAKQVALATQQLVEAANDAVEGKIDEHKLIAASKGVTAATVLLVSACRVKAKNGSPAVLLLEQAAAAVKNATNGLVEAAKQAAEVNKAKEGDEYSGSLAKMSATEFKVAQLNQRAKIEKLQQKLENNRERLARIKEAEYKFAGNKTAAPIHTASAATPPLHKEQERKLSAGSTQPPGIVSVNPNAIVASKEADATLAKKEEKRMQQHTRFNF